MFSLQDIVQPCALLLSDAANRRSCERDLGRKSERCAQKKNIGSMSEQARQVSTVT